MLIAQRTKFFLLRSFSFPEQNPETTIHVAEECECDVTPSVVEEHLLEMKGGLKHEENEKEKQLLGMKGGLKHEENEKEKPPPTVEVKHHDQQV